MVSKTTPFESLVETPAIGPNDKIEVALNKKGTHFVVSFINRYERKRMVEKDGELVETVESQPCGPTWGAKQYMSRFFEKQSLKSRYPAEKLSVPCTDTSAMILEAWPKKQRFFRAAVTAKIFRLLSRVKQQRRAAALVAKYKDTGEYGNGVFKVSEKHPLAKYQKVALHASTIANNYALFMEQGTGKTAAVIARICNEAEKLGNDDHYRAIIVAPKNVRYNWKCEIEKFGTCPGSVYIISGTAMNRSKLLTEALIQQRNGEKFTVIVMNYETVKTALEIITVLKAILSSNRKFRYDVKKPLFNIGVLDESHYIKTPGAQRSKAALELREECRSRMLLTGTPITNHPFDLFMQMEYLEQGMSGCSSFSAFKNFYGVFEPGGMGYEKLVDLQNIPTLQERLSRVSFQIRKKEALPNLPEKVYDKYGVDMTKEQADLYRKIAAQLVAEIEMEQASGKIKKEFMTNHILTKLLRLAQVTSGFVGFPEQLDELTGEVLEERSEYVMEKNPKLDALVEILKEKDPTQKTIIWACFVQDIKSISKRLTEQGIKHVVFYGATSDKNREAAVRDFNHDPEVKVFLGNPEAASTGLNLIGYPPGEEDYETNCDHVIFYSQNWKPAPRIQAEDRAHRRGTRQNVRITELVIPGTIDAEIRRRVEQKREMAEDVGDVSQILKDILASLEGDAFLAA